MKMIRYKQIDFKQSAKRRKTTYLCTCCDQDINPNKPHRMVYVTEGLVAIHPADIKLYLDQKQKSSIDIGPFPIGMKCAKNLGLEWTVSK